MFKRIMVPLDRSPDQSSVLEQVKTMALAFQAQVHLISVEAPVSPKGNDWQLSQADYLEKKSRELRDYLESQAQLLRADGCQVTTAVLPMGNPVTRVLDEAAIFRPDLIMMQSHGRMGLSRLLMGSNAEEISRHSSSPVLLVHRSPGPGGLEPGVEGRQ